MDPPRTHITRPDLNSPYPTTFVTADSSSFKQVVQLLTRSNPDRNLDPQSDPPSRKFVIPPIKPSFNNKKQQLYERRNDLKNNLLMNNPLLRHQSTSFLPRFSSPKKLSPSILNFPALTLSPVTPLSTVTDKFESTSHSAATEGEKAIADKGFYLHPSPRDDAADKPQLLCLFPLTSPNVSN